MFRNISIKLICALLLFNFSHAYSDAKNSGWLDNDPNTIWGKSPGFYKEGENWIAIVHVHESANKVELVGPFTNWQQSPIQLTQTPDKKFWWFKGNVSSFISKPSHGDTYKFIIDGGNWIQDPAARWQENTSFGANSKYYDTNYFQWDEFGWQPPSWDTLSIYQLHPRRFSKRNTHLSYLQRITEELNNSGKNDYINHLGVKAIELLPINAFPSDLSWGYNPSFWYAIEDSYGTPDQLKELVNTAHKNGIAVILDLVYNHGGNGDNILAQVDFGTYYDGDTVWGPLINFDNDLARHFFTQNAKYLAQEFRIDGFRFDHVKTIYDPWNSGFSSYSGSGGGWNFTREVREKIKSLNSNIILIAEDLPNNWWSTQENVGNSWGTDFHGPFDSQWADNFRDKFYNVLAGGHLDQLYDVFTYFGDSWHDPLIYVESHDEVGNEDKRVAKTARDGKGWEISQVSASGTMLARGIPMYFMGHESGEDRQFGINDWSVDATLDLDFYENDIGRSKVRNWFAKMSEIRNSNTNLFASSAIQIIHLHNDNGVVAFTRDNGKYLVILNFKGNDWWNYNINITGNYQEIANTSWPQYRVSTEALEVSRGGQQAYYVNDFHIPKYGAVVLVRWD